MFFLRHFRACGEVKLAAERTGVAVSTLYRWRDRDDAFRKRWDSLADQRRQTVEDRLMNFVLEGEKTAVFHKGEQVGWRVSHTARAAIAALAYFDRREKAALVRAAQEAKDRERDQEDDDYEDDDDNDLMIAHEKRMRELASASRSDATPEPKEAVKSATSPAPAPRKIGNVPALPAFDRDRAPAPIHAPRPQPPVVAAPAPAARSSFDQVLDDPATQRRHTQQLLHENVPGKLVDNWKPF